MNISINEVFGWSAASLSIFIYIIIIKESIRLFRIEGKYKTIPIYVRLENILNYFVCSSWLIYSYFINNNHLLISNLIGTILFFFWIIFIFLIYFRKINFIKYLIGVFIASLFIPCTYFLFQYSIYFGGKICAIIYIISFFSYFLEIKNVIITKNYKMINICLCIIKLLCHFIWFIYGFIIIDMNIVIPNVIGFIITFILAFFWNIYKKKSNTERLSNRSIDIMRNRVEFTL